MEYVKSFEAEKAGKAYFVKVRNVHPDKDRLLFHVDSGSSVTFLGLDAFCDVELEAEYNCLLNIVKNEIEMGDFEKLKSSASTVTKEEIEMYPCRLEGVSIAGTKPITLYFYLFIGNIDIPLLGFDYIDDCSYQHTVGGDLIFTSVAEEPGKRFYPSKVIDFNEVLDKFEKERIN